MTSARKRPACWLALMLLLGTCGWAEAGAPAPAPQEKQAAEFETARRGLDAEELDQLKKILQRSDSK